MLAKDGSKFQSENGPKRRKNGSKRFKKGPKTVQRIKMVQHEKNGRFFLNHPHVETEAVRRRPLARHRGGPR